MRIAEITLIMGEKKRRMLVLTESMESIIARLLDDDTLVSSDAVTVKTICDAEDPNNNNVILYEY